MGNTHESYTYAKKEKQNKRDCVILIIILSFALNERFSGALTLP